MIRIPLIFSVLCATAALAQSPSEKLAAHTQEFRQEVIQVTDGVHVAIGFGLANSILIEGDDGVIIVDTTEGPRAANPVKAAFNKITSKPVKAIIYTHFHADHIGGASILAGDDGPQIYSHELTLSLVQRSYGQLRQAIIPRSLRQFGLGLPPEQFLNCGIGLKLLPNLNISNNFMPPTITLDEPRASHTVAGIKFDLVQAPGETDDQLYVWLPDKKVLLPGDNFYKSFPNLYAIRGTSYRDVRKWADSLDKMLQEGAEYLIPSHTRPIIGAETIKETLTNYRDAIRFVHDETVKGINQGLTPDQLVQTVILPDRLADLPYLQEFYGTVPWSVRSIYNGYLGWFDGNPTNLFPLTAKSRADHTAQLVGGPDQLLTQAQNALTSKDYQWAAELADHLIALDHKADEAKAIKSQALTALGLQQISANGRNYYLTTAQQLKQ